MRLSSYLATDFIWLNLLDFVVHVMSYGIYVMFYDILCDDHIDTSDVL